MRLKKTTHWKNIDILIVTNDGFFFQMAFWPYRWTFCDSGQPTQFWCLFYVTRCLFKPFFEVVLGLDFGSWFDVSSRVYYEAGVECRRPWLHNLLGSVEGFGLLEIDRLVDGLFFRDFLGFWWRFWAGWPTQVKVDVRERGVLKRVRRYHQLAARGRVGRRHVEIDLKK